MRTGLSKRVLLPVIFVFVLSAIFVVSRPRLDQLPHVGRGMKSQTPSGVSASMEKEALDKVAESADMIYPLFDYTYDKIATLSAAKQRSKDPCIDVLLPNGGSEAKEGDGQRVLVTGGAGFIGSNLVDRLLNLGYKVRIFDNLYTGFIRNVPLEHEDVEFVLGDILDHKALDRAMEGIDYVFHLAAMSKVVPSLKNPDMARFCTEANALGSWNVLDSVRQQGDVKKVIYAASSTYYGNRHPPHSEDMAADFLTPYAASKFEGEIQMQMFDRLFGVPTISTRFFMVYGPRQPSTGAYAIVTGVFAKQAADNKPLTIEGDGTHYRDFIHVSDIVEGLILSQQHENLRGDVVNLGTGTAFSVNDVANLVSSNQVHVDPRPNDLEGTLADTCKMKRLLNYRAKSNFKKQMAYMAKETMEGNVFMQPWLKTIHALSAPHLLAPGSPVFKWPATTSDLDALLLAIKHVEQSTLGEGESEIRRLTVVVFSTKGDDAVARSDLLLNTIFSLVRFGEVRSYLVAAVDEDALEACVAMNLPCYDAHTATAGTLVSSFVTRGLDVHLARLGNSYVAPVSRALEKLAEEHGEADVYGAAPQGDVFIRASDNARAAMSFWTQTNKKSLADVNTNELLHNVNQWPAMEITKHAFVVEQFCNATWVDPDTPAKSKPSSSSKQSSSKTEPAKDDTFKPDFKSDSKPDSQPEGSQDSVQPGPASQDEEEDRTSAATDDKITRRAEPEEADDEPTDQQDICERKFYRAVGCAQAAALPPAADVIAALRQTRAWHLTECFDKEHCDRQQTVPARWVASPPDLALFGGIC